MKTLQSLSIADYFKILRRRIWYIVITTAVVGVAATTYVWRLPPLYKSETVIMVSPRLLPENYIAPLVQETAADRIDFVRNQLRSRAFVERIIQEFQLGGRQAGGLEGSV